MQNMKYSFDIQPCTFENNLKISADKLFVVTYKHLVSTAVKLRLTKGLGVVSAGVLTTYRKTLLKLNFFSRA